MSLLKIASWTAVHLSVAQYNELSGRELPDQQLVLMSSWVKDCAIQQMYPPLSALGHILIAIWWMSIIYFTAARAVVAEVVQITNAWRASKPAGVKEISDIKFVLHYLIVILLSPCCAFPSFPLKSSPIQSNGAHCKNTKMMQTSEDKAWAVSVTICKGNKMLLWHVPNFQKWNF